MNNIFLRFPQMLEHIRFLRKKPRVIPKILKGFFKAIVLRRPVLRSVDWSMLYDCNFKCEFCSAHLLKNPKKKYLTIGQIKQIWKQASKLGAIHVNLTGGEPLLRKDICEVIKVLEPKKHLISLVTNSWLLDKEKIFALKKAGLDTIQLSIESVQPEIHDKRRRIKGSNERIMKAIKYAKQADLNICLSTILSRESVKDVWELAEFCKKENLFLLLNLASAAGRWQGKWNKKLIDDQLDEFKKLMKHSHVRSDIMFNFNGKQMCPGGKERIEITAYGDVMMCPLVQISYGNVLKEPLEIVWRKMMSYPHIKKFYPLCKQAWDEEYYENILKPIEKSKQMPVPIEKLKWLE